MAKNKIQIDIEAKTQGALNGLKATEANINKLLEAALRFEREGKFTEFNNTMEAANELIARASHAMYRGGKETSQWAAGVGILNRSIENLTRNLGGAGSEVDAMARSWQNLYDLQNKKNFLNGDDRAASDRRWYSMFGDMADNFEAQDIEKLKEQAAALREMNERWKETVPAITKSESVLSKWGKRFKTIVTQIVIFRTVMNIQNKIINTFTETLSDSVETAAEAEQVYSKLATVFNNLGTAMDSAEKLSVKLGVSTVSAASALSTVGDLLQAQGASTIDSLEMATEWVEKFADIIAFKDIDMSLEEFAQNFMSGAAGNLRNFRTFGSIVKESAVNARLAAKGMDDLTGSELELAKMTARAEIALEQQANAIGATSREWDTMLSVNRRYEESMKQWKTDIGETINKGLKPMKQWWTGIIDEINKANAAQKAYNEGKSAENSYDVKDNEKDYGKFRAMVASGLNTALSDKNYAHAVDEARRAIMMYNADLEDTTRLLADLENGFDDVTFTIIDEEGRETYKSFLDLTEEIFDIYRQEEERRTIAKQAEEEAKAFTSLVDSVSNFYESLMELEGVNFVDQPWYKAIEEILINPGEAYEAGKDGYFNETNANTFRKSIEATLKGIADLGYTPTQILFGEDDKGDLLEKKISEYRSLYDKLLKAQKDGMDVTEKDLNDVKLKWDDATQALKDYNEELENQKKYTAAMEALNGNGYADNLKYLKIADNKVATEGMSEQLANAYATLMQQHDIAYELAKTTGEDVYEVHNAFKEAWADAKKYFAYVEEKEKKAQREADYTDALTTLQNGSEGLASYKQMKDMMANGATEEYARAFINLLSESQALEDAYNKGMANATTQDEIDALTNNFNAAIELLNLEFADATKTEEETIGDEPWYVELLKKTEAFQKLTSIVDDYIVPIIDMVLSPMLPIIELMGETIQDTLMWLQPILVKIVDIFSTIGTFIVGIHVVAHNILVAVKKLMGGKGTYLKLDDELKSFNAKMLECVNAIENWTHETAKNTGNDYSTYADLRRRKMLSESDYLALIGSNKYSSVNSSGGVTMTTSGYGNTRYVTINGLTLNVGDKITNLNDLIDQLEQIDRGSLPFGVGVAV